MLLVVPQVQPDGSLLVNGPDAPELTVARPSGADLVPVQVWKSRLLAALASAEAAAWFSKVVGRSVRLVYLDDPTRRRPNPDFADPTDYVSFADGYPLLLASIASLDQLNDWIADGRWPDDGPLPMTRFRPNVVVAGATPWVEDGWRRVRIGDAIFRSVKGCDRCVMTMTDPDSGRRTKEPIATLAKHRQWDGATWFGMNLVPDTAGAVIRVGDDLEILHEVPAPDGPPR